MTKPTVAELEQRLAAAQKRTDREHKRSAAANIECEALRRDIRTLRHANHILQRNIDGMPAAGYKVRYEKLVESLGMIRELANPEVTGIPYAVPTTLEPWLGPSWARNRKSAPIITALQAN